MGDRAWTGIQFSGTITEDQADELLGLLNDQCGEDCSPTPLVQGHGECKFTLAHLRYPHNQFVDDDCNYAAMEGLEAWCRENHVTYLKSWAEGGGYAAGYELYLAIVNQSIELPGRDEVCVGVTELRALRDQGSGIEEVIGYMEGIDKFDEKYPPLEIIG